MATYNDVIQGFSEVSSNVNKLNTDIGVLRSQVQQLFSSGNCTDLEIQISILENKIESLERQVEMYKNMLFNR